MLTVLNRYILRALLFNYVIALAAMMSLYIVLDMFVNLDEFTEQEGVPLLEIIQNIASYYAANLFLYFSQLSGAITLFACSATLARMRKANELTAVLASGVSLYRIAAPVIAFGLATTGLLVLDTEWAIPAVAPKLARDHDDADGKRAYAVHFLSDRNGALLSAVRFDPLKRDLHQLLIMFRDAEGNFTGILEADRATWEPPDLIRESGRWSLQRGKLMDRTFVDSAGIGPQRQKAMSYPQYYESDLSPDAIELRQSESWIRFLSLSQLRELEQRTSAHASIAPVRHARHVTPILSLVMLLLGLPFFLNRSPANILSDAGKCMVVCGSCYVMSIIAQSLRFDTLSALPVWTPVFVFGTLAIVLLDRIRT